jgi:hypothetical protein
MLHCIDTYGNRTEYKQSKWFHLSFLQVVSEKHHMSKIRKHDKQLVFVSSLSLLEALFTLQHCVCLEMV